MSDQKKYEQMMGQHVHGQAQRERQQQLSPEAQRHFARPANVCELCGVGMYVNPKDGTNKDVTEWEKKWSVHRYCAELAQNRLDRESGILTDRQSR